MNGQIDGWEESLTSAWMWTPRLDCPLPGSLPLLINLDPPPLCPDPLSSCPPAEQRHSLGVSWISHD